MDAVIVLLRLLHIGGGIFWVGAAFTMFFFVQPTLEALGPQTQQAFMQHITRRRKLLLAITTAATVNVSAGVVLYWVASGGFSPAWLGSSFGSALTMGAASALSAYVVLLG